MGSSADKKAWEAKWRGKWEQSKAAAKGRSASPAPARAPEAAGGDAAPPAAPASQPAAQDRQPAAAQASGPGVGTASEWRRRASPRISDARGGPEATACPNCSASPAPAARRQALEAEQRRTARTSGSARAAAPEARAHLGHELHAQPPPCLQFAALRLRALTSGGDCLTARCARCRPLRRPQVSQSDATAAGGSASTSRRACTRAHALASRRIPHARGRTFAASMSILRSSASNACRLSRAPAPPGARAAAHSRTRH